MNVANIPMRTIGPINIIGEVEDQVLVPLATLEKPLWPSVSRGARVSRSCGGIKVVIVKECMTRSVILQADGAESAYNVSQQLERRAEYLQRIVSSTSNYTKLEKWQTRIVGDLLYIRFEFTTGDAAGHNMTTKAADALLNWLLNEYKNLRYVSISGNYCVDKKVSAVNSILGRGKYVIAEMIIPRAQCRKILHTDPEKVVELNINKNLLGSIVAGGICSANAHFANMLLAFYLATGQDGANIVEGSQGIVNTKMKGDDLYFAVTLPNIIVGTIGSGKDLAYARHNLELLGCVGKGSARRLAIIVAATVLCGELSLLAAQTQPGVLVRSHIMMER